MDTAYAVEASSRLLYTLEQGEVISKRGALDWAATSLAA
ncbi:MAG: aminoglycoside adenylyltransferase domain-containing protein [Gaiellaceae bacterium]